MLNVYGKSPLFLFVLKILFQC